MSEGAGTMLLEPQAIALVRDYGIPYPDHGYAHSAKEAVELAERLGYPVVLKVVSLDVPQAGTVTFAYMRDPEGNIIELQNWSK